MGPMRLVIATLVLLLAPLAALAQGGVDFGDIEARLRLNAPQKAQFDAAVAATRRAMLATGLVALEIKGRLADELARDRPNLDRLLADPDALLWQVRPQWREAHEEWARFYALLDERQVVIARRYVERRLEMLEDIGGTLLREFRDRLRR